MLCCWVNRRLPESLTTADVLTPFKLSALFKLPFVKLVLVVVRLLLLGELSLAFVPPDSSK